uniref:Lysophosphatidylcholine acyltransferase 1 n=1 Tax=Echeneis naucrates TaxID=173247 RepID=A0A665UQZ6_ECHNA
MTVTLFPIRLLIAAFMMLLAWPFAFLASVGRTEISVEPQCLWRRLVDIILKIIMRVMWFAGGFHWITVKGQRALPAEAPILTLAPHSSYFDAIPVTMTMASIVMKAESKDIPLWGTLIKYIRPVFVSRSDQDSRKKTVEEIRRRAHSGGEWPQIMIFPEGTCTNRSCLITFKPGSSSIISFISLGVPITDYSFEDCQLAMAEGQLRLPVDTCLLEFAKLIRRLGLKPQNTEKVLQEYGNRARKLEGQKLGLDDFAQFLDVPVSDMLRDMFALFDEHEDNCMDIREYVIALSVVCRPAKTLETMKLAFKMFEAEEDGAITEMELAVILKTALGVSHLSVSRLFTAIDSEDTGKITFDKFRYFVEQHPDFAEEYLHTENIGLHSSPRQGHQIKASLSCLNPHDTATSKTANGICPDFSPKDHDGTIYGLLKKHN